jgi:hypothetical protein
MRSPIPPSKPPTGTSSRRRHRSLGHRMTDPQTGSKPVRAATTSGGEVFLPKLSPRQIIAFGNELLEARRTPAEAELHRVRRRCERDGREAERFRQPLDYATRHARIHQHAHRTGARCIVRAQWRGRRARPVRPLPRRRRALGLSDEGGHGRHERPPGRGRVDEPDWFADAARIEAHCKPRTDPLDLPVDVFFNRAALATMLETAIIGVARNDRLTQVKLEREASLKQRRLARLGIPPLFVNRE